MRYSKWDEVVLKVADQFGYTDKVFSRLKVTVIGVDVDNETDYTQYLCYIPPYETLPYGFKSFAITRQHVKHFGIDEKFIDESGCFITAMMPIFRHIQARPSEKCVRCQNWFDGATKVDDSDFTCYSCRSNPYR